MVHSLSLKLRKTSAKDRLNFSYWCYPMKKRSRLIYEFGPYRLDLGECRLLRRGQEITLRPKLFDLLAILIEHHGQMLEKDDLIHSLWPDTEVEDSNLTVSINALRRALGDDIYIETVSRRGYRF